MKGRLKAGLRPRHVSKATVSYPTPVCAAPRIQPFKADEHGLVRCDQVDILEAWTRFGLRSAVHASGRSIDVVQHGDDGQQTDGAHGNPTSNLCVRGRKNAATTLTVKASESMQRQDSMRSASSYGSTSSWTSSTAAVPVRKEAQTTVPSPLGQKGCDFEAALFSNLPEPDAFFPDLARKQLTGPASAPALRPRSSLKYSTNHRPIASPVSCCSASTVSDANTQALWKSLETALGTRIRTASTLSRAQLLDPASSPTVSKAATSPSRIPRLKHNTTPASLPRDGVRLLPVIPRTAHAPASWDGALIHQYDRITAAGSAARQRRIRTEERSRST